MSESKAIKQAMEDIGGKCADDVARVIMRNADLAAELTDTLSKGRAARIYVAMFGAAYCGMPLMGLMACQDRLPSDLPPQEIAERSLFAMLFAYFTEEPARKERNDGKGIHMQDSMWAAIEAWEAVMKKPFDQEWLLPGVRPDPKEKVYGDKRDKS